MLQSLFSLVNMSLQSLGSNQRNYAEIQITIEPEFSVIAQLKVILIIKMSRTKITMMQLEMKLKIWVFVMVKISAWTWIVTIQSCIWRWFISVLVKIKMSSILTCWSGCELEHVQDHRLDVRGGGGRWRLKSNYFWLDMQTCFLLPLFRSVI